ncbi:TPA: prepilin-type N-terminal cleavage/methylation domain-containing protein, partial [Enterobacter hormaechei subsp. steigerwaltii]|nr:prepilin-type N-terminal cleavage/methylation domain-containing protein [Enterobacter hormaechei subsp. steigerwaltii]
MKNQRGFTLLEIIL